MNNIEMKKRPCGRVMSLCGYIYLFFMLLLLSMNNSYGRSAEERVQAFEQGLHEQAEMDVSRIFDYGQEPLALADRMAIYGVPGLSWRWDGNHGQQRGFIRTGVRDSGRPLQLAGGAAWPG